MQIFSVLGLCSALSAFCAVAAAQVPVVGVRDVLALEGTRRFVAIHPGPEYLVAQVTNRARRWELVVVGPTATRALVTPPRRGGVLAAFARAFDEVYVPGDAGMMRWDGSTWRAEVSDERLTGRVGVAFVHALDDLNVAVWNDVIHLVRTREGAEFAWRRSDDAALAARVLPASPPGCALDSRRAVAHSQTVRICGEQLWERVDGGFREVALPSEVQRGRSYSAAVTKATSIVFAPREGRMRNTIFCRTQTGWASATLSEPIEGVASTRTRSYAITATHLVEVTCP